MCRRPWLQPRPSTDCWDNNSRPAISSLCMNFRRAIGGRRLNSLGVARAGDIVLCLCGWLCGIFSSLSGQALDGKCTRHRLSGCCIMVLLVSSPVGHIIPQWGSDEVSRVTFSFCHRNIGRYRFEESMPPPPPPETSNKQTKETT